MLTVEERSALKDFGYTLLGIITQIATSSFLYGVFALLFSISTRSILKRERKGRPTKIIFAITVLSFLLATLYWIAIVMSSWRIIHQKLMDHTEDLSLDRTGRLRLQMQRNYSVNQMTYWLPLFGQIMNDSIITWRAWALCLTQRWLMTLPILLLISTFGVSLSFLIIILSPAGYADYTHEGPSRTDPLLYAAVSLMLANNLTSTSLIAYRLWLCRKLWNTGWGSRWSHAHKILLMVVESGALYAVLQVIVAFLFNRDHELGSPLFFLEDVIWVGYIHLTAMYATFVFVLISHQRSMSDMECFTPGATGNDVEEP